MTTHDSEWLRRKRPASSYKNYLQRQSQLDPRLVAIVKLLARIAAENDYNALIQSRNEVPEDD